MVTWTFFILQIIDVDHVISVPSLQNPGIKYDLCFYVCFDSYSFSVGSAVIEVKP